MEDAYDLKGQESTTSRKHNNRKLNSYVFNVISRGLSNDCGRTLEEQRLCKDTRATDSSYASYRSITKTVKRACYTSRMRRYSAIKEAIVVVYFLQPSPE